MKGPGDKNDINVGDHQEEMDEYGICSQNLKCLSSREFVEQIRGEVSANASSEWEDSGDDSLESTKRVSLNLVDVGNVPDVDGVKVAISIAIGKRGEASIEYNFE